MEMPRRALWGVRSEKQIFISEQDVHPIKSGPGIVITSLIPDIDHFNVRGGGIRPLYRDAQGFVPNVTPGLLNELSGRLGIELEESDLLAYIAATVAHHGYTSRFAHELKDPGVRIPLTADLLLWEEALFLGRQLLWLHTFGERYADPRSGRPLGPRALVERYGVRNTSPIVSNPPGMPESIEYDACNQVLRVGSGELQPVPPRVWEYDVGGMRVVRHWFDYRCSNPRHKKRPSELDDRNITHWTSELTEELLALLSVLKGCVELESYSSIFSIESVTVRRYQPPISWIAKFCLYQSGLPKLQRLVPQRIHFF
jgi:hypothetical protein